MRSRRKFTKEFKLDAVQRLRAGEPAGLVARSLEVSRQELYRWSRDVDKFGERAFPGVGQKRAERRGGLSVNRKRVQRLMREDNLLCLRKRKFVATTDSAHGLKVYPNLAAALVVSGVNQLWRADITYIRLLEEFVYLAVVLDGFSRRAIGGALDSTLEASLAVAALEMALERRRPAPGLVHHSDQGVQYVSHDYVAL